jgi:hypothetical protein
MSRVTVCSLSLAAVLLTSSLGSASQSPVSAALPASALIGCEGLPSSWVVDSRLRLLILDMRRRAPTFRRQVARLVQQSDLVVTVGVWQFGKAEGVAARTSLTLQGGLVRSAAVQIRVDAARLIVELIAHEFEHILEQLDGIDLTRWLGRSGVYRPGGQNHDGPIETERARRLGRIVAGEYAAAEAAMPACGAPS